MRQLAFWQVKEYRLDRALIHYQSTPAGKLEILDPLNIAKWLLLPLTFAIPDLVSASLLLLLLFPDSQKLYLEIKNHTYKRPKVITSRIILIAFFSLLVLTIVFVLAFSAFQLNLSTSLLLSERLTWLAVAAMVGITSIPAVVIKKLTIKKAKDKRDLLSSLIVVGITGSVGKTSTKEFLSSILSFKLKTVSTSNHDNTDIGISQAILNKVTTSSEVFIAEMGAYKRGEIASLCRIARPQIGIITAVGLQHLDLFGSPENIKKAKFELIENLEGRKIAVLNADNPESMDLIRKAKKLSGTSLLTFSTSENTADIVGNSIKQETEGISFVINMGGKSRRAFAPVFGYHFVKNILAAVAVAGSVGMNIDEIVASLLTIKTPTDALNPVARTSSSVIFDDTYNSSPESVEAAVELLNSYPGIKNRILVLQPLIELGKEGSRVHTLIGSYLANRKLDLLILTNSNFTPEILNGAKSEKNRVKVSQSPLDTQTYLVSLLQKSGIIFKGKEALPHLRSIVPK